LGAAHDSDPIFVHIAFFLRPPNLLLSKVARRQQREGRRAGGVCGSIAGAVAEVVGRELIVVFLTVPLRATEVLNYLNLDEDGAREDS
jgi:hypothetical protein